MHVPARARSEFLNTILNRIAQYQSLLTRRLFLTKLKPALSKHCSLHDDDDDDDDENNSSNDKIIHVNYKLLSRARAKITYSFLIFTCVKPLYVNIAQIYIYNQLNTSEMQGKGVQCLPVH